MKGFGNSSRRIKKSIKTFNNFNKDQFENLDNKNRKLISEKEKLEQEKKILSKSKDKISIEFLRIFSNFYQVAP